MKQSYIANSIIQEYNIKQAYKRRARQRCKEIECDKCKWQRICEDREEEKKCYKVKY